MIYVISMWPKSNIAAIWCDLRSNVPFLNDLAVLTEQKYDAKWKLG